MLRVSGTLQKSTDVMKLVNETLKLPEMQRTMFEMSRGGRAVLLAKGPELVVHACQRLPEPARVRDVCSVLD